MTRITTASVSLADPAPSASSKARRAAVATIVGNSLEWFDFATYAFLATVIAKYFFPAGDPTLALLSTYAAFGLGFVARPLGALFFGRLGDRRGRRLALLIAMPLMGLGTLAIGLIPSYAAIGIAAPIALVVCRLIQGFSAGGELGNAVVFLSEWAPPKRRGLFSSFQQFSTIGGTLLGSGAAALLNSTLAPAALESWGWRLPFIFGGLVIAPLGFYLRNKVEETPVFEKTAMASVPTSSRGEQSPWIVGARLVGVVVVWTVSYYVFLNYLPTFLQRNAGISASTALWANTVGLLVMMLAIPAWGHLSDIVGRKPPMLIAAACFIVIPYPVFSLLVSGASPTSVVLVQVGVGLIIAIFAGIGPALMSEMFPTRLRTTGVSVGFGLSTAIFGGFAPFISAWLIDRTGSPLSPVFYVIAAACVSTLVIATLRETVRDELV